MDLSFSGTTGSTELRLFRLPRWLNDKRTSLPMQETQVRSIAGLGGSPRSRKWQPNPVFLPGKFHAQMSLAGYSPWGQKSDTTDNACTAMNCLRLFTEWVLVTQCPTLCHPMDSSLSMGFSRQEYWNGLPCPSPGNFLNPGMEELGSLALQAASYHLSHQRGGSVMSFQLAI